MWYGRKFFGISEDMRCVVYCPSPLISHIKLFHLALLLLIAATLAQTDIERKFTDEFVLHLNEGEEAAHILAAKHQLIFERRVNRTRERTTRRGEFLGLAKRELFCLSFPNDSSATKAFGRRIRWSSARWTARRSESRLGRTATGEETCEEIHSSLSVDQILGLGGVQRSRLG